MPHALVVVSSAVAAGAAVAAAAILIAEYLRRGEAPLPVDRQFADFKQFVERNEALRKELEESRRTILSHEHELVELRRRLQSTDAAVENAPLFKVVLTGGPCGGKTTAKAEIKARFESLGFLVLCGVEAATLLFGGGVPFPHDEASRMLLQRTILKLQMSLEDMLEEIGRASGRPTLILLDRGALDGKAYVSEYEWELLLDDVKLTTVLLRDQRYDAIIHLVTAAQGAESFYTLANNETRIETPDEAREQDRRTLDAWTGHEHLYADCH